MKVSTLTTQPTLPFHPFSYHGISTDSLDCDFVPYVGRHMTWYCNNYFKLFIIFIGLPIDVWLSVRVSDSGFLIRDSSEQISKDIPWKVFRPKFPVIYIEALFRICKFEIIKVLQIYFRIT